MQPGAKETNYIYWFQVENGIRKMDIGRQILACGSLLINSFTSVTVKLV